MKSELVGMHENKSGKIFCNYLLVPGKYFLLYSYCSDCINTAHTQV